MIEPESGYVFVLAVMSIVPISPWISWRERWYNATAEVQRHRGTYLSRYRAGTGTLCKKWCLKMRERQRELAKRSHLTHRMFTDVQKTVGPHTHADTHTHTLSLFLSFSLTHLILLFMKITSQSVFWGLSCQQSFGHTRFFFYTPSVQSKDSGWVCVCVCGCGYVSLFS